ncbi:MAG: hypothetical protein GF329_14855 [Candidatus Lokiarchaeota archaeon]|nr:hypothetical protein [Candidatus Lokiarchaeota archaeon]
MGSQKPLRETLQIIKKLNEIRHLIINQELSKVFNKLDRLEIKFKEENDKLDLKIIQAYLLLLDGIEKFGNSDYKKAITSFKKSMKKFQKFNFLFEVFKTSIYLGIIYNQFKKSSKSVKYYQKAWNTFIMMELEERDVFKDVIFEKFLIKEVFSYRGEIKNKEEKKILYSKKLEYMNKEKRENEHSKIEKEYITFLFNNQEDRDAIEYLIDNKVPIDNYYNLLSKKLEEFKNKPDLYSALYASKILLMDYNNSMVKVGLNSWKQKLLPLIYQQYEKNQNIINSIKGRKDEKSKTDEKYTPLLDVIFSDTIGSVRVLISYAEKIKSSIKKYKEETDIGLIEEGLTRFQNCGNDIARKYLENWSEIIDYMKEIQTFTILDIEKTSGFVQEILFKIMDIIKTISAELKKVMKNPTLLNQFIGTQIELIATYYQESYKWEKELITLAFCKSLSNFIGNLISFLSDLTPESSYKDQIAISLKEIEINYYKNIWINNIDPQKLNLTKTEDIKVFEFICDKLLANRSLIENSKTLISLLKEKIKNIDKQQNPNLYGELTAALKKTNKEHIKRLIKNKDINQVLEFISNQELKWDKFISDFQTYIDSYKKSPTIQFANIISIIFSLKTSNAEHQKLMNLWKTQCYTSMYDLFSKNFRAIFTVPRKYKKYIEFILAYKKCTEQFVLDISNFIKQIISDPNTDKSIKLLEQINKVFQDIENGTVSNLINLWYMICLELRKNQEDQDFALIVSNFLTILINCNRKDFGFGTAQDPLKIEFSIIETFFNKKLENAKFLPTYLDVQSFYKFYNSILEIISDDEGIIDIDDPINRKLNELSLEYFKKAWQGICEPDTYMPKEYVQKDHLRLLVDKLYPNREKLGDIEFVLGVLEGKLSLLDKEENPDLFTAIQKEISGETNRIIEEMLNNNNYIDAIQFAKRNKIYFVEYIPYFKKIIKKFKKNPSLERASILIKLLSLDSIKINLKSLRCDCGAIYKPKARFCNKCGKERVLSSSIDEDLLKWNEDLYMEIYQYFISETKECIQTDKFKEIVEFILGRESMGSIFVNNISYVLEDLFNYPSRSKRIMAFLLYTIEILQDLGYQTQSMRINEWIQITIRLRRFNNYDSADFCNFLFEQFEKCKDQKIPNILFKMFIKKSNYLSSEVNERDIYIREVNRISEFLYKLKEFLFNKPNFLYCDYYLEKINTCTKKIAGIYKTKIKARMQKIDLMQIELLGNKVVPYLASNLLKNISSINPEPMTITITSLLNDWRYLPTPSKTIYLGYGSQTRSLKPEFWLIVLNIITHVHFEAYYKRLVKNEELKKENLMDIVQLYINFWFIATQTSTINVPSSEIFKIVIKYLKGMNDACKFSDDQMRQIVKESKWKSKSKKILKEVIEFKNYCIYCNYNMPPNSKVCPNCDKPVGKIPESPDINLDKMKGFFSSSTE